MFGASIVAFAGAILAFAASGRSASVERVGRGILCLGVAGIVVTVFVYVIIPDIAAHLR
ncbi:MAG: hypothetical protein AAB605_02445 [Patescibacteria group bacterium]